MTRLVALLTGRRSWAIALVGLLLGAWVIAGLGQAEREADPLSSLPAGFESTQGQALLEELPDEGASAAIVLFTHEEGIEPLPSLTDTGPQQGTAPMAGH